MPDRSTSQSKLYVAQMEKYPEVVSQLFCVAAMLGMREETDVVGVADGGNGLREELESQLPNHAVHFGQVAPEEAPLRNRRGIGFQGKTPATNGSIQSLTNQRRECSIGLGGISRLKIPSSPMTVFVSFIAYLTRFEDAVDYDHFKELGYPIGSGEVESAHRSIPQKRLKLPGACWHP